MAISAKDRFARLPKARQAKILARAEEMIAEEMTLTKLREARARSQAELAAKLGIQQAAVSRLERRHRYVSEHAPESYRIDGRDTADHRSVSRPPPRLHKPIPRRVCNRVRASRSFASIFSLDSQRSALVQGNPHREYLDRSRAWSVFAFFFGLNSPRSSSTQETPQTEWMAPTEDELKKDGRPR